MVGTTISHYKILEKLGEGGMGVVYKAQDTKLDRLVALKFLPPHLAASEQDKARFIQEAKAASALNHPNVCTIHDIEDFDTPAYVPDRGTSAGRPAYVPDRGTSACRPAYVPDRGTSAGKQMFIVMEYVDGQTLHDLIKGNRDAALPMKRAIDIGIQIADGLSAAHEKGIVHRDIKPENIMVRKDGIVQDMDFGLAKLRASKASRLTKEGSTLGTAAYMSPEQVQGQDADHRSDVFSLGVLLYELFTAELPFKGVHETALMYEIVNVDPVPMRTINPDIDPELDRIVLECMQKEPDERYNSVKDIAKDLKRFKRESSRQRVSRVTTAHRVQDQRAISAAQETGTGVGWKRFVWPGVILLSGLVAAFTLWQLVFRNAGASQDVVKFTFTLPPGQQLGQYVDISPDGKQFAYAGFEGESRLIYVRAMSDLEPRLIPGTEGASRIEGGFGFLFSPDGDWLGFNSKGKLKKISLRGGSPIELCTMSNFRGADWGDDNSIIFTPSTSSPLWRVSADGGIPQPVTTLDSSAGEISHRYPEILPGSKAVLFTVKTNSITRFSDAKIAVQRLDFKEKKILIEGGSFVRYIPTGHLLYGQGGSIYAISFDLDRLELKGSPVRVLEGGMFVEAFGSMTMSVSKSGTLIYAPGGPLPQDSNRVLLYDRKGNSQPLVDAPGGYGSVEVSPDREHIASYMLAANDDIWVYDIQRHLSTRFTFGGGNNWYPRWTPDGKHIVYTAERAAAPNLFWKSTDGSGTEERLARGPYTQLATSWSPDGKLLAFHQSNAAGNFDVWVLAMEGDRTPRPFAQTKFNEEFASFSPDGRWLAYQSDESGQPEIYAVPFPKGDGKWRISPGGGTFPCWVKGKSGEEIIYFNSDDHRFLRVPITFTPDLHPGRAEELFRLPDNPLYMPDISPDGEQIAVVLPGQQTRLTKLVVVVNWFEELKKQLASKQ